MVDTHDVGNKTVKLVGSLLELVPEVGNALKDGNLTDVEAKAIQSKLDEIKGCLHQIKDAFKL